MSANPSSYLVRRGGTWSFRCRVPQSLVERLGRREVVRALRTGDGRLAGFLAASIAVRVPQLWAQMTTRRADLDKLVAEWFAGELERAFRSFDAKSQFAESFYPPGADPDERARIHRRLVMEDAENILDHGADRFQGGDHRHMVKVARGLAEKADPPIPEGSQAFAVLTKTLDEGEGLIQEARIRWAEGDIGYRPEFPEKPQEEKAPPPEAGESRTVREAIEVFLALEEARATKDRDVTKRKAELEVLTRAYGDEITTRSVTKAQAGKIFEALQSLPGGWRAYCEHEGLTFFEAAKKARESKLAPQHPRTVNGVLQSLRVFFASEIDKGYAETNPFAGMKAKVPKKTETERAFEKDELEALISSPLFRGARSSNRAYDPGDVVVNGWRFWAPLIALCSGARVAEIAQLRPQDVRQEQGVWVFDINAQEGRSLKTVASQRLVPVHSQLLRIGVLGLAKSQAATGVVRLLPGCPAPVGGDAGKQLSKWMSEKWLKRFEFKTRRGMGFHSFRHSLTTQLRNARVESDLIGKILGHENTAVRDRYGRTEMAPLRDALESVWMPDALAHVPARYLE